MGLFKSAISDARPAKFAGQSAYAAPSLSGQLLHSQLSNTKVNDSGPNASVKLMHNRGTSDLLSPYDRSSPAKPGLSNFSGLQQEHRRHGETDLNVAKQSESAITASQNNLAAGLKQQIVRDDEHIHRSPDIDQPIADPTQETRQSRPDLSVFTLIAGDVENMVPVEINHGGKPQPDPPQGFVQITDYDNSTTNEISDRAISDDTAAITIGRDNKLYTAVKKATQPVESGNRADLFWEREKEFHSEEKLQATTSENYRQLSGPGDGANSAQTITVERHSAKHHPAIKVSDEKSSSSNNSWDRPTQQQSIDSVQTGEQPIIPQFSVSPEPSKDTHVPELPREMQQQHQEQLSSIEKQARLVETRVTSHIDDQFARHYTNEHRNPGTTGFELPRTAEVRIGQVDVFVEKSSTASSHGNRTTRQSHSLASRHYLRRL